MTHIWGQVEWWDAIFHSHECVNGKLVLILSDGTTRTMNDWDEDTQNTLMKLKNLKAGDAISVGTWGGRKKTEWFCDVEKINL